MKKRNTLLILGITLAMSLTACGSSSAGSYESAAVAPSYNSSADSVTSGMTYSVSGFGDTSSKSSSKNTMDSMVETEAVVEEAVIDTDTNVDAEMTLVEEKLVYHCNMEIESKEYEQTYASIKALIEENGGLIQSETQRDNDNDWYYERNINNYATLKGTINCRIPSKNYENFVNSVSNIDENSKVVSKNTSIENISQQYYDNKTRIEALEIQEARLLQMMQEATDISDMIAVEDRLTEVQYELSQLNTQLIYMDMDVAYSYVNITLEEVKEYTTVEEETTFFSRLWDEAKDAWEMGGDLFEGLLSALLHLIPIIIFVILPIIVIVVLLIKLTIWIIKKMNKKHNFVGKAKSMFSGDTEALKRMEEAEKAKKEQK